MSAGRFAGRWPRSALFQPRDVAATAVVASPPRDAGPRPPSLNPAQTGAVAALLRPKAYTGDAVLGVAAMHKSNLVPVFSEEEAKDVARMRRG